MIERLQTYTVTYAFPGEPVSVDIVSHVIDSTIHEPGVLTLQVADAHDRPSRAITYAPGVWLYVSVEVEETL